MGRARQRVTAASLDVGLETRCRRARCRLDVGDAWLKDACGLSDARSAVRRRARRRAICLLNARHPDMKPCEGRPSCGPSGTMTAALSRSLTAPRRPDRQDPAGRHEHSHRPPRNILRHLDEGLRASAPVAASAARRVAKSAFASGDWYDVWFPNLSPTPRACRCAPLCRPGRPERGGREGVGGVHRAATAPRWRVPRTRACDRAAGGTVATGQPVGGLLLRGRGALPSVDLAHAVAGRGRAPVHERTEPPRARPGSMFAIPAPASHALPRPLRQGRRQILSG